MDGFEPRFSPSQVYGERWPPARTGPSRHLCSCCYLKTNKKKKVESSQIFQRIPVSFASYLPGLHSLVEPNQTTQSAAGQTEKNIIKTISCQTPLLRDFRSVDDISYQCSVNGRPLSEHQWEVGAAFIKMNVLLKKTGHSKHGNVTLFKCQPSCIIDLFSTFKYGTGISSGNGDMSAVKGDDPQALFLHAFHTVKNCQ